MRPREARSKRPPRRGIDGQRFSGTVYDPVEKEVIIGADCTLEEKGSKKAFRVKTDNYGDFWFEDLAEGIFDLRIEKDSRVESFTGLNTADKDINLGDIALSFRKG